MILKKKKKKIVDRLTRCFICHNTLTNPRTLPCLHSFCVNCLEQQQAGQTFLYFFPLTFFSFSNDNPTLHLLFSTSSSFFFLFEDVPQLFCHQCETPFTVPDQGGIRSLGCLPFVDSIINNTQVFSFDRDAVTKCDGCGNETATVHCVECGENMGPSCLVPHKRMKATSSHQQILLEEVLTGATRKGIIILPHRCQTHQGVEIDTYCQTCTREVCLRCLAENHSGHTFCMLSQVSSPLQDQVAGFALIIAKREQEAERAVAGVGGTLAEIEEGQTQITALFASLHKELDARQATLIAQLDQGKETVSKEKREVEATQAGFKDFRAIIEELLAQGTPHEIIGSHKMVRGPHFDIIFVIRWCPIVFIYLFIFA